MATAYASKQARKQLDQRFTQSADINFAVPGKGWIRAIRDALHMTAAELASRMGVTGSTIRAMEETEVSGGIRLETLQRAARAMDCTLVYAFVPNSTLQETVEAQARAVLKTLDDRTRQAMVLEAQTEGLQESEVEALISRAIALPGLWSRA